MADAKISALAAITTIGDADEYVVAQAGATKKITGANLKKGVTGAVGRVIARQTDSAAKTNNTLASDDTLLLAVSGNSTDVWFFKFHLIFNAVNATMDAKIGWAVPTGTTMKWGYGYVAGSAGFVGSPASAASYGITAPLTQATTAVYATGTTTDCFANGEGYIYVGGTSGNVNLQWAQNTTDAANLILLKGSHLLLTKVI